MSGYVGKLVVVRPSDSHNLADLNGLIGRVEDLVEALVAEYSAVRRENSAPEAQAERLREARRQRYEAERFLSVLRRLDRTGPAAARASRRPGALVITAVGALTFALAAVGGWLWDEWGHASVLVMLANQGVGVCCAAVGLAAWRLRPHTPAGLLMTALGELALISNFNTGLAMDADMPGRSTTVVVGTIATWLTLALAARLLLGIAAPTPAKAWLPHRLVGIAWVLAAAGPVVLLPLKTPVAVCGAWCGASPFSWNHDASLYLAVRSIYVAGWIVLAMCGTGVIVRRYLLATPRQRRTHGLALISASAVMVLFALGHLSTLAEYLWPDTIISQVAGVIAFATLVMAVVAVPVAFTAAALGEQATLAGIAVLLGRDTPLTVPKVEDALRTSLRDPTLRLIAGPPQTAPAPSSAQCHTPIGSPPIGTLVHDLSLLNERQLLGSVVKVAHLVIEQHSGPRRSPTS
ncbi:hypothetical protein [Streptomyces chartreusis]|uniref:hypothetical protein n=1 Tax=Streptomyces chartreusis TaxID=1969 RepID=UPI00378D0807